MNGRTTKTAIIMTAVMPVAMSLTATALAAGNLSFTGNTVFSQFSTLISDAQRMIIGVSTPAAGIGVGVGALMKKFAGMSGAEAQQKMTMGNKIITSSIVGWAAINGLTLILSTVRNYL